MSIFFQEEFKDRAVSERYSMRSLFFFEDIMAKFQYLNTAIVNEIFFLRLRLICRGTVRPSGLNATLGTDRCLLL